MTRRFTLALVALALAGSPPLVAAEDAAEDVDVDEATEDAELDLAMLGLDDPADDKLNIYGFADVSWRDLMTSSNSVWKYVYASESAFAVGSLNVYLTRNLGPTWRALIELRYTYAPNGTTNADGSLEDTSSSDQANLARPVQWGGMVLERAHLEHDLADWLTLRAGTFLTPYGIWNVDHGSPAIIPSIRPYIIGEQLFPERQTGLELFGSRSYGDYNVGYHATLSNGRGPLAGFRDLDTNKAIGGRLELETRWFGATVLGVSGYAGRYTERPATQIHADSDGNLSSVTPPGTSFDEQAVGADVLVKRGPLHVQAELLYNVRRYRAGSRAPFSGGFVPDSDYGGSYLLVGYRLERWWHVMPYAVIEYNDQWRTAAADTNQILIGVAGLNLRPLPSVVLKLEAAVVDMTLAILPDPALFTTAQAAWVF